MILLIYARHEFRTSYLLMHIAQLLVLGSAMAYTPCQMERATAYGAFVMVMENNVDPFFRNLVNICQDPHFSWSMVCHKRILSRANRLTHEVMTDAHKRFRAWAGEDAEYQIFILLSNLEIFAVPVASLCDEISSDTHLSRVYSLDKLQNLNSAMSNAIKTLEVAHESCKRSFQRKSKYHR